MRDDDGGTDQRAADRVGRGRLEYLAGSGFRGAEHDPNGLAVLFADADLHRVDLHRHAKPDGVERLPRGVSDSIDERCVADVIGHAVFLPVRVAIADVIGISVRDGLADGLALRRADTDRLHVW